MRDGIGVALASLGRRAQSMHEKIAASRIQVQIATRAIASLDAEIAQLEADLMAANERTPDLERAVIAEAVAEPLRIERAAAIDALREVLVRQAAVERVLEPERHDYAPPARVVVEIPSLVWADGAPTEIVLAPGREIKAATAVVAEFARALKSDPLTPAPSFPDVDPRQDDDVLFHELSLVEQAEVARNATYTSRQRPPLDQEPSFTAKVLDAAKSAIGI
jgi:hypothetical protein